MQTFLPYPDFYLSSITLDNKRLGKQRVEAKQIMIALEKKRAGIKGGWQNHPATLMWEGRERMLARYGWHMCMAWIEKGFKDSLRPYFAHKHTEYCLQPLELMSRVFSPEFFDSHKAMLYRKDPVHYAKFADYAELYSNYVWPVSKAAIPV